jgi:hypothetical protein
MQKLNFPQYKFKFKNTENKIGIFAHLRKKFIVLTPEEWVRQHCVQFLIQEKKYPITLLSEEKKVEVNGMPKRYDILGFNNNGQVKLIVECKAPSVKITQSTFDQIARYNLSLNAEYLMLTNGLNHYFCKMDYTEQSYFFLKDLPEYAKS